jgi:hypothetical protein
MDLVVVLGNAIQQAYLVELSGLAGRGGAGTSPSTSGDGSGIEVVPVYTRRIDSRLKAPLPSLDASHLPLANRSWGDRGGDANGLCRLASSLKSQIARLPKGTYFSSMGGSIVAGLGFNSSVVIFADNVTGLSGYYTSFGFSLGLSAGISTEIGFAPNQSPQEVANSYSLTAGGLFYAGKLNLDAGSNIIGGSGGLGSGPDALKVGISLDTSEPISQTTC